MVKANEHLAQRHAVVGNCGAQVVTIPPPSVKAGPFPHLLGFVRSFFKKGIFFMFTVFFLKFVFFSFFGSLCLCSMLIPEKESRRFSGLILLGCME